MKSVFPLLALSTLALARPSQVILGEKAIGYQDAPIRVIVGVEQQPESVKCKDRTILEDDKSDAEKILDMISSLQPNMSDFKMEAEYLEEFFVKYFVQYAPAEYLDPLSSSLDKGTKELENLDRIRDKQTVGTVVSSFSEIASYVEDAAAALTPLADAFNEERDYVKNFKGKVTQYAKSFSGFGQNLALLMTGKQKDTATMTKKASDALTKFADSLKSASEQPRYEI